MKRKMSVTHWNVLSELVKNSKQSDREIGRKLGRSQPTITRIRRKLEKEGYIKEYTVIPDFELLGFELMSMVFVKLLKQPDESDIAEMRKLGEAIAKETGSSTTMSFRGMGLGFNAVVVSFHRDYAAYNTVLSGMKQMEFINPSSIESFLIDLSDKTPYLHLSFKSLSRCMPPLEKK
jgi:DNA-binding Lrp family transcriptional regulator